MKRLTLLLPAFGPKPYPSATPQYYQSSLVDKFDMALAALVPGYVKHANAHRMYPDEAGRWVTPLIVVPYDFVVDQESTTLHEIIALALKTFKLEKLTVLGASDAYDLTLASLDELELSQHDLNV